MQFPSCFVSLIPAAPSPSPRWGFAGSFPAQRALNSSGLAGTDTGCSNQCQFLLRQSRRRQPPLRPQNAEGGTRAKGHSYCPYHARYLWLKVWSPTEAEANTIALQKLDVWPRHKAKMLETPEPMTWKKGKIKYRSTFSVRKKATPFLDKLFPFTMARARMHQVLLKPFFVPVSCFSVPEVCPQGCDAAEQRAVLSPSISISVHPCVAVSSVSGGHLQ